MLTYKEELENIPLYISGMDRVSEVNNLLEENPEYRLEARGKLDAFLARMIELEASDIDFGGEGAQGKIWYRIYGEKRPDTSFEKISTDENTAIICSILSQRQIDGLMMSYNTDFSYKLLYKGELHRFRADSYMDLEVLAINFRHINPRPFDLANFGFPNQILRKISLAYEKKGLILVTGITGSGKSTTLDAIIDMNNRTNSGHIVIIGSPIEYFHKSQKCIVRHREVGRDTLSFKEGSIEALRQDPDIIVVGEMRDPETIVTVLETTDSGHKVLSTLHTSSAVESVHRIVAECPTNEQQRVRMRLADTLSVVVSQKLVPSLDGKRVLSKEILNVTPSVQAAIINNNIGEIYQMITEGKEYGMITMEQDLFRLFATKQISWDNALAFANNKKRIEELLDFYRRK